MNKQVIAILLLICSCTIARADHITGGEMYYTYTGSTNGLKNYSVTLKLYMRCNSGRQFNNPSFVSVFDRVSGIRIQDTRITLTRIQQISINSPDPCITNHPTVCYDVGFYEFQLSLPSSATGYLLASQVNYRINTITNLQSGYRNIGATYTAEIPGTTQALNAPDNNSATFTGNDLVVVCADNTMSYSFAATDLDGDKLRYSFCNAHQSTNTGTGTAPSSSNFPSVPYGSSFASSSPLGNKVKINPNTGLITGIAPSLGIYVVTVCVEEIRNGVVIAQQRKDLQINIAACDIAAAVLEPEYSLCKDTDTYTFTNLASNSSITSYAWSITDSRGVVVTNESSAILTYAFPDTGLYTVQLSIKRGEQCTGTTSAISRVYPGFVPAFNYNGICFNKPTAFTDATTSRYGVANKWNWDFGDAGTSDDLSDKQHPFYTFRQQGSKNVSLIVENSFGCKDTANKTVAIIDKPPIDLAFKDTLICVNDHVQLAASGGGNFSWTGGIAITNANSSSPVVSPLNTTWYYVNLNDNGCVNNDSVLVRVTDRVNVRSMNDTTICAGDTISLITNSDGFRYLWTPSLQIMDATAKNARAITNSTTTYEVTASIGGCTAKDQVVVSTVPYPTAFAGNDTILCFGSTFNLFGVTDGSNFSWSPNASLINFNTLSPTAKPPHTTSYILTAFDNKGCPKPFSDTVVVTVIPDMNAYAGRDTTAIVGQPLQLSATGGDSYLWTPSVALSASNISNPVAMYDQPVEKIQYKVLMHNEAGCVDSAYINVKVFNTGPTIFVPTAFTPNNDGKNDFFKPIAAGMKQIENFSVYNRWGQLMFRSGEMTRGWDGSSGGIKQASGTYVWMVKAIDYNGKPYLHKGTVTLIR